MCVESFVCSEASPAVKEEKEELTAANTDKVLYENSHPAVCLFLIATLTPTHPHTHL